MRPMQGTDLRYRDAMSVNESGHINHGLVAVFGNLGFLLLDDVLYVRVLSGSPRNGQKERARIAQRTGVKPVKKLRRKKIV
jgi:hypothetical protein